MSDSLKVKKTLRVNGIDYQIFSLPEAAKKLSLDLNEFPFSLRILLENLLRYEDGKKVTIADLKALCSLDNNHEIEFTPARVLMQDFTGVPAVVDLAVMREAITKLGGDANKINPLNPVDLVIDHSVQVDQYGKSSAFEENVNLEFQRNMERYQFLRWGQQAFDNFKVVPPGTGICHQVNLEYLSQVVWTKEINGETFAFPDSLVGTDSHTTMVNGLSVLGWGVGGIEAEAVMLGEAMSMLIPEVVGFKLTGKLAAGTTTTDLVLTVTQMLRKHGVVNKFVEFYGPGLNHLSLADRATLANMAPEYGATCGFFPIDDKTIEYLKLTARNHERIELVKEYAKAQNLWRHDDMPDPKFNSQLFLDLGTVVPCLAGPKRPQDRVVLDNVAASFVKEMNNFDSANKSLDKFAQVEDEGFMLANGDIVIAAITSCTNTSNPGVMMAAGILAKNAASKGLTSKPWVKTSLAPGSQVVSEYLQQAGLQKDLDALGFNLVGYGCTTCIGNSGPLKKTIENSINKNRVVAVSVLSGNRNFEGRIHPCVQANYLASPPLVVAYAIAGNINIDLTKEPLGQDQQGNDVYLKDVWPSQQEINDYMSKCINRELFARKYAEVFVGDKNWQGINVNQSASYSWDKNSTYIANPPYFDGMKLELPGISTINNANLLAMFGDSITTDHISPAGNISAKSPAGKYLLEQGVKQEDFNSYGARRGHHEVMMRGTFANIRIKNELVPGTEGGVTIYFPTNQNLSIYDAAMKYKQDNTPLIIMAGKEYGTGSSRDWAAKGTMLLGVKAVIAESFERIHRSNLVRMGVIPLTFKPGMSRTSLPLTGREKFTLLDLENLQPSSEVKCIVTFEDGHNETLLLDNCVFTANEVEYLRHGGILQYVIRQLMS